MLRYRPGVQPAMRFRKGARLFHIVTVINSQERNLLAHMFVRGAGAMTAAVVKGLEILRRRLIAAAAPQPLQAALRVEADAIAEEARQVAPGQLGENGRSDRSEPRNEPCLCHRHAPPGRPLPRVRHVAPAGHALALADFPRPFTRR